jgi:hypothetical protein
MPATITGRLFSTARTGSPGFGTPPGMRFRKDQVASLAIWPCQPPAGYTGTPAPAHEFTLELADAVVVHGVKSWYGGGEQFGGDGHGAGGWHDGWRDGWRECRWRRCNILRRRAACRMVGRRNRKCYTSQAPHSHVRHASLRSDRAVGLAGVSSKRFLRALTGVVRHAAARSSASSQNLRAASIASGSTSSIAVIRRITPK